MRNIVALLIVGFVSCVSFAQELTKDELIQKISDDTCVCMAAKDFNLATVDKSTIEMTFGLCVMESYGKYPEAVSALNVSFEDDKSLEKLGELIALRMMNSCPDVMSLLVGNYMDEIESDANINAEEYALDNMEFSKLERDQLFNVIRFKDASSGRSYSFLWLTYFEGSQYLQDTKKIKKTNFSIQYKEQDFYDSKIEDYRNFKIITKLTAQ
ncbi:hypothetical protein ACFFVB_04000 [Formosa undariae]|uniref:DUF4919 domain-containing protein n=1 Tax=Formosa undariae TaxID=1325436 RepID=A0ABV5EYG0_9FLAO